VAANTYLFERVRTFLDVVDFGTVRANDPGRTPQTLMIYQADGSDFQVKVSTDAPALLLKSERGPKGDRYQVTVSLIGNALKAGPINGSITIETSDTQISKTYGACIGMDSWTLKGPRHVLTNSRGPFGARAVLSAAKDRAGDENC